MPGQQHDVKQAQLLLQQYPLSEKQRQALMAVLGDKGFDSQDLIDFIESLGAEAVIPPRKGRKQTRDYDRELYKERNKVERFFNRIKHYRRIATRYDKSAISYASFLQLACIMTWLL